MFPKNTTSPRSTLLAIDGETAIVAGYMKAQFLLMQNGGLSDTSVSHPKRWTLDFAIEADQALNVILHAIKNQGAWSGLVVGRMYVNGIWQVSTVWDVQRYADHINLKNTGIGRDDQEEALSRMFKPVENAPTLEVRPCTITDRHRRILLWYLPNILTPERQVNMQRFCNARRCLQSP